MWPSSVSRFSIMRPLLGSLHGISSYPIQIRSFSRPSPRFAPTRSSCLSGWGLGGAEWCGCRFSSSTTHARRKLKKMLRGQFADGLDNEARVAKAEKNGELSRNARTPLSTSSLNGITTYPPTGSGDLRGQAQEGDRLNTRNGDLQRGGDGPAWSHPGEILEQNLENPAAKLRGRTKSRRPSRTPTTLSDVRRPTQEEEVADHDLENHEAEPEDGLLQKEYMSAEEAILSVGSDDPFSIRDSKGSRDTEAADGGRDLDEAAREKGEGALAPSAEGWGLDGRGPGFADIAAADDEDEGSASAGAPAAAASDEGLESKYLPDVFPDLAAEYGAENATPVEDVTVDSAAVVGWRCLKCGEAWRSAVFVRCVLKTTCPGCAARQHPTLAAAHPELVPFWDPTRNDPFLSPESVDCRSVAAAHWLCPSCGQSYTARIRDCVRGRAACPSCALAHVQSADVMAREEGVLLQEWHPLKNGDLRLDQVQMRDQRTVVWWMCSLCGHDWEASLAARLSPQRRCKGKVCPVCKGKGVDLSRE